MEDFRFLSSNISTLIPEYVKNYLTILIFPEVTSMSSSPAGQSQEPLYSSRKRGFLLQIIYIVQAYSMPYIKLVSSYFGVRGRNSKRDHHM